MYAINKKAYMESKKTCSCLKAKQYTSNRIRSKKIDNFSCGALNFEKTITHGHGENWRRKEKQKSSKK